MMLQLEYNSCNRAFTAFSLDTTKGNEDYQYPNA